MDSLLEFIDYRANENKICKEDCESDTSHLSRVIYSLIGIMASSCLWDRDELEEETIYTETSRVNKVTSTNYNGVSVNYWKRTIKKLFYAYCTMYPSAVTFFPVDLEKLIRSVYSSVEYPLQEHEYLAERQADQLNDRPCASWEDLISSMLELFVMNGAFYKRKLYVAPARKLIVQFGSKVNLMRGLPPGEHYYASGLGAWNWTDNTEQKGDPNGFIDAFGLQQKSYLSYYDELYRRLNSKGTYNSALLRNNPEVLRIQGKDRQKWGAYWLEGVFDEDVELSLARYGNQGQERYFLYQVSRGRVKSLELREFETNPSFLRPKYGTREYLRIASAILAKRGVLPSITSVIGSKTVEIQLGYLLPPREDAFLRYYSWPIDKFNVLGINFNRRITKELYAPFKEYFCQLGYSVNEIEL